MNKHSLLIALCFIVTCQLTASPIDLTATSATATWPAFGPVEFSIAGPSLGVSGRAGFRFGLLPVPVGAPVAEVCRPLGGCMFQLNESFGAALLPECFVTGIASGRCMGTGTIFPSPIPSTLLVPSTPNPTISIPVRLIGGYDLCSPGPFPLFCTEPLVAHIDVDLPGELILTFAGPFAPGIDFPTESSIRLLEALFVSTPIPESSSLILMLIGSAWLALAASGPKRGLVYSVRSSPLGTRRHPKDRPTS